MAFLFIVYVPYEENVQEPCFGGKDLGTTDVQIPTEKVSEKEENGVDDTGAESENNIHTDEDDILKLEKTVSTDNGKESQDVPGEGDESVPDAPDTLHEETDRSADPEVSGDSTGSKTDKGETTASTTPVEAGDSTGSKTDKGETTASTTPVEAGDSTGSKTDKGETTASTTPVEAGDSTGSKTDKGETTASTTPVEAGDSTGSSTEQTEEQIKLKDGIKKELRFQVEALDTPDVAVPEDTKKIPDGCIPEAPTEQTEVSEGSGNMSPPPDGTLTPLVQKTPLHKDVEDLLISMNLDNIDVKKVGGDKYLKISFVQEDSLQCESILNKLKALGIGQTSGSVSVFPSSLHESALAEPPSAEGLISAEETQPSEEAARKGEEVAQKESQFKKSIKSRMVVAQVIDSVRSNATFTFDYLLLLILASLISCLGLVENSSVVLVASMLISPLMGPILAVTFGQVIQARDLRNLGLKSEIIGLSLCVIVGFLFGLISGGIGLHGAVWGSSDQWPTTEMKSRGMLRSLWVGVLIALPSGAGVAISVLGGNAGSLVGVAISASLLPPACNAGMLWAYALLAAISPPAVQEALITTSTTIANLTTMATLQNSTGLGTNSTAVPTTPSTVAPSTSSPLVPGNCLPLIDNGYQTEYSCNVSHDAVILGMVSLLLTLLNITCILIMGYIILRIKEVAPHTAGTTSSVDSFWQEDVKVARTYYQTTKGQESKDLGRQFVSEWKKIKKETQTENESEDDQSISDPVETMAMVDYITDVEASSGIQHVLAKLSPTEPVSKGLLRDYSRAALNVSNSINKHPAVYLAEPKIRDAKVREAYHTIHGLSEPISTRPGIRDLRDRFRKVRSMHIPAEMLDSINEDAINEDKEDYTLPHVAKTDVGILKPHFRNPLYLRRKRNKFEVSKVEEQEELV